MATTLRDFVTEATSIRLDAQMIHLPNPPEWLRSPRTRPAAAERPRVHVIVSRPPRKWSVSWPGPVHVAIVVISTAVAWILTLSIGWLILIGLAWAMAAVWFVTGGRVAPGRPSAPSIRRDSAPSSVPAFSAGGSHQRAIGARPGLKAIR